MASTTEIIDVTPDQTLMPKLGKSGYSIPQAIAELLDNAIDARIEGELLHIAVTLKAGEITVADDGMGMDREGITNSMILGRSSKRDMLGEFGLGLKTACTSLGKSFSVASSKLSQPFEYVVEYDEERWIGADDCWRMQLTATDREPEHHYTIVRIGSLQRFYAGLPDAVRRDVQRRFAPFIDSGEVQIKINRRISAPEAFDLVEDSRHDFAIADELGYPLTGWYGLLKQGSNKGYYGFHTYRRGRMITTYDKIGIGEHPTISRIIGEIHMDEVPVTHNKREFEKESAEYVAAVRALRAEFADIIRQARQRTSSEMLNKTVRNEVERWKDALARALTTSELRTYASEVATPTEPRRDDAAADSAEVEVEKRQPPSNTSVPPEEPASPRERVPRQTHKRPRHVVKVRGRTIDFRHEFAPLGEREVWYRWAFDDGKALDIYTNTDFPAYFTTRDKAFYAAIHIAESIAQLMARECSLDASEADDVKQLILRKASAVKDQWIDEDESANGDGVAETRVADE